MAHGAPDWTRQVQIVIVEAQPADEAAAGGIGRHSGTEQTYQEVIAWTVSTGKIGELKELILISNDFAHTHFRVTIGSVTYCEDTIVRNVIPLVFADLRLAAAGEVKIECKSTDGTSITVDGVIVGKEVG